LSYLLLVRSRVSEKAKWRKISPTVEKHAGEQTALFDLNAGELCRKASVRQVVNSGDDPKRNCRHKCSGGNRENPGPDEAGTIT
jgi:hypothetical protein